MYIQITDFDCDPDTDYYNKPNAVVLDGNEISSGEPQCRQDARNYLQYKLEKI